MDDTREQQLALMLLKMVRAAKRGPIPATDIDAALALLVKLGHTSPLREEIDNDVMATGGRRCPNCDSLMHHERLRGWVCGRC